MSLTLGPGPLGTRPGGHGNYRIEGPAHRLWLQEHPRRLRAVIAGRTVLDTVRGALLHESNLLPRLYVPFEDFDASLLEPTDHHTHCPFKGDAAYWSVRVGDRVEDDAIWAYPQPIEQAAWLAPYASLDFDRADAWYEEDELVVGHLRDPYHRVDIRSSSRPVEVLARGEVVARSERAVLLFETGLPVRAYLPLEDVPEDLLVASDTATVCPYKGTASYRSLRLGDDLLADAMWCYEDPLPESQAIAGLVCFAHEEIETRIADAPRSSSNRANAGAKSAAMTT